MADNHVSPLALEMRGVHLRYPDGYEALRGVNLQVQRGEIVALLGASGSGKSTVLRAVAGLEPISAGEILIDGVDVRSVPVHKRDTGMVFQDGQLFPHRNVARNVAYGLEVRGLDRAARDARVAELLELVGLAGYGDRPINTLSGGQAQRVALARSLAPQPALLLLDEPLSALDADLREDLSRELREILKSTGTAALYVTHDRSEAERAADRIVTIKDGQLQ